MCNKVDMRVECLECGYPYSEARYPDDPDGSLTCNSPTIDILGHIMHVESLIEDRQNHPYDCLCMLCR